MQNPYYKPYMQKRVDYFSSAIMYTEKFETWLNLDPLYILIELCRDKTILEVDWKQHPGFFRKRSVEILSKFGLGNIRLSHVVITPLLPSIIVRRILGHCVDPCHVDQKEFVNKLNLAGESALMALRLQLDHIGSKNSAYTHSSCVEVYKRMEEKITDIPIEVKYASYVYEDLLRVLNYHKDVIGVPLRFLKESRVSTSIPSLNMSVIITPDIIILDHQPYVYLLTIPYFLEIFNKVSELCTTLRYFWFQDNTTMPPGFYGQCCQFLTHLSYEVSKYEKYTNRKSDRGHLNKGFIYLKAIEGLGVSELIARGDKRKHWPNTTLCKALWKALYDDDIVTNPDFKTSELWTLFQTMEDVTIAELIGNVKLLGHPAVDIEQGLDKLYKRTHTNIEVNPTVRLASQGILIRDLMKNFRRKHGRYPVIDPTPAIDPRIVDIVTNNLAYNSGRGKKLWNSLTARDWSAVHLGHNAEFDKVVNQLTLLKDKSLGLTRSNVVAQLLLGAPKAKQSNFRKALLEYLFGDQMEKEFSEYFSNYNTSEPWNEAVLNYLVIKLTAKELELKPEGRMFGASPIPERNRRVVQEKNTMTFLDAYVPDQLLTPNELAIIRKLISFRNIPDVFPNCTVLHMSFDFSRWNNNFRRDSIDTTAGHILDKWYNTHIYGRTMEAYEKTFFYYDDNFYKRWWDGQLGGIEGLNQSTWSYVFLGGIKYALEQLGHITQVTVKGDDVRAAIIVQDASLQHDASRLDQIRNDIMATLERLCAAMGWQLNPQESFVSLSVICTSKQYFFNDTWLPASSKKIAKLESHSNVILNTIDELISSIFSVAHSACSQTTAVIPAYTLALYTSSILITRQWNKALSPLTPELVTIMISWPQVIGGLGSLPLQTFFVRGENDMLSVSISLMRHLLMHGSPEIQQLTRYILSQPIPSEPNPHLLLGDPYSIDLSTPERPLSYLKRALRHELRQACKHPEVAELLSYSSFQTEERYKSMLLSARPFCAKIVTAVWECSPFALIEELLAKFLQSSTILALFSKTRRSGSFGRGARVVCRRLSVLARKRWNHWENILLGNAMLGSTWLGLSETVWRDPNTCNSIITQRVRDTLWNRKFYGLTYPSLIDQTTVVSPLEIMNFPLYSQACKDFGSLVHVKVDEATYQTSWNSHHYANVKGIKPWLGANTSSKLDLPDLVGNIMTPTLRKLTKLIYLLTCSEIYGPSYKSVISVTLSAYTSTTPSDLLVLGPKRAYGHAAHRIEINSYSTTTMPNFRPNINQIISHDIAPIPCFSAPEDRTLNFAGRYYIANILTTFYLQAHANYNPILPTVYYVFPHIEASDSGGPRLCRGCFADVSDIPIEFDVPESISLREFSSLTLVRCSDFEQYLLDKNIKDVIDQRIQDVIIASGRDKDSSIVKYYAIKSILSNTRANFRYLENELAAEHVPTVPEGELLDTVIASLGLKSLRDKEVSLKVWRSCPTNTLYLAVVSEMFTHICQRLSMTTLLYQTNEGVNVTPDLYAPLAPIFKKLGEASALGKLTYGSRNSRIIKQTLQWFHGSETHAETAAQSFLLAHWATFIKWYKDPLEIPSTIFQTISGITVQDVLQNVKHEQNLMSALIPYLWDKYISVSTGTSMYQSCDLIIEQYLRSPNRSQQVFDQVFSSIDLNSCIHIALYCAGPDIVIAKDYYEEIIQTSTITEHNVIQLFTINDELGVAEMSPIEVIKGSGHWSTIIKKVYSKVQSDSQVTTTKEWFILMLTQVYSLIEDQSPLFTHSYWLGFLDYIHYHNSRTITAFNHVDCKNIISSPLFHKLGTLEDCVEELEEKSDAESTDGDDRTWTPSIVQYSADQYIASCTEYTHWTHKRWMHDAWVMRQLWEPTPVWEPVKIPLNLLSTFAHPVTISLVDVFRVGGNLNHAIARYVDMFLILQLYDNLSEPFKCLVVGDGAGSVSALLLRSFPNAQVVMCTLSDTSTPIQDTARMNIPYELISDPHSESFAHRFTSEGMFPGDITNPEVRELIINQCEKTYGCFDLLISDCDMKLYKGSPDRTLLMAIAQLMLKSKYFPTRFIIRCLGLTDQVQVNACVDFANLIQHSHIVRSIATQDYNDEVFLIGHLEFADIQLMQLWITRFPELDYSKPHYINYDKSKDLLISYKPSSCYEVQGENTIIHRDQPPEWHMKNLLEIMAQHISNPLSLLERKCPPDIIKDICMCSGKQILIKNLRNSITDTMDRLQKFVKRGKTLQKAGKDPMKSLLQLEDVVWDYWVLRLVYLGTHIFEDMSKNIRQLSLDYIEYNQVVTSIYPHLKMRSNFAINFKAKDSKVFTTHIKSASKIGIRLLVWCVIANGLRSTMYSDSPGQKRISMYRKDCCTDIPYMTLTDSSIDFSGGRPYSCQLSLSNWLAIQDALEEWDIYTEREIDMD